VNVGGRRLVIGCSWGQLPPIAASLAADFFSAATAWAFFLRTAFKFIFIC